MRPTDDPKHPGVAMIEASKCRRHGGPQADKSGDDVTGIANKTGKTRCNHCGNPSDWIAFCPHRDTSRAELKIL